MKTIVKYGWVGKADTVRIMMPWADYTEMQLRGIFPKKMTKETWKEEDWPPTKVRITIEEVK